MKRRILLVDDDLPVLLTLKALLEFHGFEADTASTTSEALTRLESSTYQLVIADLRMDREDSGLKVIEAARKQSYDPATALLTAYASPDDVSLGEHADSLLVKPIGTADLLRQLEVLLIQHEDAKQARMHFAPNGEPARVRKAG